eukprot:scaffold36682_cov36-Prasinocladus_malaysianus.AAC.1
MEGRLASVLQRCQLADTELYIPKLIYWVKMSGRSKCFPACLWALYAVLHMSTQAWFAAQVGPRSSHALLPEPA